MNNKLSKTVIATALLAAAGSAQAGVGPGLGMGIGVGAKYSTLGAGVEIGKSFTDFISVRLGLNKYSRSDNQTIDDIAYDADLDLSSTALMLDWHPFGGSFRLTAGYVNSGNELTATATPTGMIDIGGTTYNADALDITLNGAVKLGSGPYLGLGWGSVPASGFGFMFEAGFVQMGTPDVDLVITGTDKALVNQTDINDEVTNMKNDLDGFETYPVVGIGISYGF